MSSILVVYFRLYLWLGLWLGVWIFFDCLARRCFTPARGWNGQIHLMFPLPRPKLARPALQRNRAYRRTIFIPDDFAPSSGIGGSHL